jgi:hypothetical protein
VAAHAGAIRVMVVVVVGAVVLVAVIIATVTLATSRKNRTLQVRLASGMLYMPLAR